MIALRTRRFAARLRGACEGAAAVEFALAAPVLLVLLIGMFDMGHMAYLNAVLNGAVEKVARDSALETANTTTSDQAVGTIMAGVAPRRERDDDAQELLRLHRRRPPGTVG
ncbi:TadE/TadG family type IV pilus assembly protein [Novosphingobium colocasiae]